MTLIDALQTAEDGDLDAALLRYERERSTFGAAVVAHGRELGAYLQGSNTDAARAHHTGVAVMREIAVTRKYL